MDPLLSVFQDLDDSATVRGKDAKLLRDLTADAVAGVRQESRHTSSRLAQEIRSESRRRRRLEFTASTDIDVRGRTLSVRRGNAFGGYGKEFFPPCFNEVSIDVILHEGLRTSPGKTTRSVFMPDRRELHCVLLDRFAFNIENSTYGYDRNVISVRDFVWIYDLMPVASILASPAADLERARLPRTAALDSNPTFFFRVARFAFVTPPVWQEMRYGIVLSVTRRGDSSAVNNFKMAMEDSPEAVTITRGLARFPWPHVQENEIMKALCRRKSSCAV
ncbi:unnamed protein product, partial [Heligmosomoides polygyrus]|uniref:M96 mating-specific protein family n=1 Tax=Heligmosomoides polygyrus TaxID=6339 RepID=A0A183F9N3_HELPZ